MVELLGVRKSFGKHTILDGLNLKAPTAQITVVMGGSGHGKSTILKLIMGLIRPDAGTIRVDGEDILQLSSARRLEVQKKIGMSFQYSALFDSMNVYENCAFPLREHTHLSEPQIRERVREALERLGMPGIEEQSPAALSGGMRKRVGVARAIMLQPRLMLFDEPESGLDPITTTSIGQLVTELRDNYGITCVVISHHLGNSMRIADQLCMLYHGKIIASGSPAEMRENPHPVLQQFLHGNPEGPY